MAFSLGGMVGTSPACGCCTTSCTYTLAIKGCNSRALTSEPVSVYDFAGGTLLASGTTDATGSVNLTWSGSATAYVAVASSRFAGQTITGVCATSVDVFLSAASGYSCIPCCVRPLPNTLQAMGHTLTKTGGPSWEFCQMETQTGLSCVNCFSGSSSTNIAVNYRLAFSAAPSCSWSFQVQYPFCTNCAGHQLATADVAGNPVTCTLSTWPGLAQVASGQTYFQTTANVCGTLNLTGNLSIGLSSDPYYNAPFTVTE